MRMQMLMPMAATFIRTTIALREDLYQKLKRDPRGLSVAVNEVLEEKFRRRTGRHPLRGTWKVSERERKEIMKDLDEMRHSW
jgi:predicted CopG family antitoxin